MVQVRKFNESVEEFLSFPVLAALSVKPMNLRDLSRHMLISRERIRKRLNHLRGLGWVVKRDDYKWEMKVALSPNGAPTPTEVPGVSPETHQDAPGKVFQWPKPPEPKADQPVAPESPQSKLAKHFRVPQELRGLGGLMIGTVTPCHKCTKPTPIKYGSVAVCPSCSRLWGENE